MSSPIELSVRAILFDSDGTLIDSTPAVKLTIARWCVAQGVGPRDFAAAHHGTRAVDVLRRFMRVPKLGSECSEEELTREVEVLERSVGETAAKMKKEGKGQGIVMLPGVAGFLSELREGGACWGIVTSATATHAYPALDAAGVGYEAPQVPFVVTGEMVSAGKPDPAPYLAGLAELRKLLPDLKPHEVLVVGDAPADLQSGKAAGCRVLGVCTGPRD
ncbi:DL-glycerol-3-phosphatase [Rhodosporidiobolus nylandii]